MKTSLAFTGDIGFDHYMDRKWEDKNLLSPKILDFLNGADHVIANVEGALVDRKNIITDGVNAVDATMLHSIDPAAAKVLLNIKADIWNIANNHIMDAGPAGVSATLDIAKKCGAKTIGAGMNIEEAARPLFLKEAGGIGMFAVGYRRGCKPAGNDKAGCLSWNDMERIQNNIDEIKKTCRWCIIVSHGGEEFTSLPSPYTRDRYLKYLDMGADIVVSHHPHVPMNYETFPKKAIFYSLGNFIFDTDYQRSQFNTDVGILLKIELTEDDFSFVPFGIKILRGEERVVKNDLPLIFADVQETEYKKLVPLAAKMFIAATKRQGVFLNPDKFKNATEEDWKRDFFNLKRSGRVAGEALDFTLVYPLSLEEKKGAWKESRLEGVKKYILEQM